MKIIKISRLLFFEPKSSHKALTRICIRITTQRNLNKNYNYKPISTKSCLIITDIYFGVDVCNHKECTRIREKYNFQGRYIAGRKVLTPELYRQIPASYFALLITLVPIKYQNNIVEHIICVFQTWKWVLRKFVFLTSH